MRATVHKRSIKIDPGDARHAREQVAKILKSVRENAKGRQNLPYYFTFVIMMHLISGNILRELDPETLEAIMNKYAIRPGPDGKGR